MNGVMIGREGELAEAFGFLDEAARRACWLLLVGEPGIGKTTIWSAVLDEATSRAGSVLVARPSEAESELPFAVLADLFGSTCEQTLTALPPGQRLALEQALRRRETHTSVDPVALALAVAGVLRLLAASATVVVAIDDAQWIDPPSRRALLFALRRIDEEPVGVIATVRSEFEEQLLGLVARDPGSIVRVQIGGLGERELARLVADRTGTIPTALELKRLVELSLGSPYYALELASVKNGGSSVAGDLAATLRARLSTLSGSARKAGLTAATLGRFDGTVTGPGVDELRAAGVVDVSSGRLRFAHPLLASTLLDMHTDDERRSIHARLAAVLDDPDEQAMHLARATDVPDEAVAAELERAAGRLDLRGAPETAAFLAERAAGLTPDTEGESATRRLILAADLYQAAGEGSAHVLPLLERLNETLPPGPDHARVLLRLGWLGAMMDTLSTPEVVALLQRALTEAGDTPDVTAAAHAALARLLGNGGDYRSAHRHASLAVAAGELTEANLMFPSPSGELGTATFFSGRGFDEQLFEHAIERESVPSHVAEPYQSPKLQFALGLLYTGQLSRARAALGELLQLSVDLGRVRSTAGCILHLIELEVRAGNLGQAETHAAEFVHLDRQLRGERSAEWYPSGLVAMQLGRVEEARRILRSGVDHSRSIEWTIWLAHQLWALGHLELVLGNLEAAREALEPLPAMLRETGLGEWAVHPVHPDAIETLVGIGELDGAAELADELEAYAHRLDRPWGLATAYRSRALIASARGANDAALELADLALVEHERLEWPLERGRTLLVRGCILRRLGRRRDAGVTLAEARSLFAAIDSPLWHARAEAEERRLGGKRRTGTLTATEARVAELAAQGLRNTEIAARLYVTPKTVEATLSRAYRKLGLRSRTELARRLVESGTVAAQTDPE
jgi:DNA-binding CsgD family transcriptional regulator